jgi:hypothetical protein
LPPSATSPGRGARGLASIKSGEKRDDPPLKLVFVLLFSSFSCNEHLEC